MPSFKFTSKKGRGDGVFGSSGGKDSAVTYEEREGGGVAFYGLAPIQYPDGHYYLKVGYDSGAGQKILYDQESVSEWFRTGPQRNRAIGRQLAELAQEFVTGLDITNFEVDTCVWLETSTSRPYLGLIGPDFYIVTGDNGFAAKSSDELGRVGAQLALTDGKWPCDVLDEQLLQVRFKSGISKL